MARTVRSIQQITDRVWFVEGPASNWTIVHTGQGTVLIDAGYPADAGLVAESVTATGADLDSVSFILVTHAHTDHIGGIPALLARLPEATVVCSSAELRATRGPERDQITVATAGVRNLIRPRFAWWAVRAILAGGTRALAIPSARAFNPAELSELGIREHPAPGHTSGSTIYELVGDNAYVTGDAWITDHPTYASPRAGAIDAHFSSDDQVARQTANKLPQDVSILPGHGPAAVKPRSVAPRLWRIHPETTADLDLSS
jgi:glyoxylase-like metal-dependent hydrolase (beta-lactamase superfamily II)